MIVRWLIIVSFLAEANSECVKNRIKLWSPTDCQAGKTFFVKLSTIPNFTDEGLKQPYLYPWLVEINIAPPGLFRFCSGALINDRYVLTAQSCILPPVLPPQVTVTVGFYNGYDNDISEIFQPRILQKEVAKLLLHPSYNPTNPQTFGNNLGLIKLNTPVKYSKTIYPIQLPTLGDKFTDYGNKLAEKVEWSFFSNSKDFNENAVKILSATECGNFNNNYRQIVTPEVICAVDVANIIQTCGEENGGLLTLQNSRLLNNITVLVGIKAWTPPSIRACRDSSLPTVYVRIDQKLPWITDNTLDALYCRY